MIASLNLKRKYICASFILVFFSSNLLATDFLISFSGNYALGQDILSSPGFGPDNIINIASSDVSLDLGGKIISLNNGVSNISGIVINPGLNNIKISNGTVRSCTGFGISIGSGCSKISLRNILVDSCAGGILFDGSSGQIINSVLTGCNITSCNGAGSISYGLRIRNGREFNIKNCMIERNSGGSLSVGYGLSLESSINCYFDSCNFDNNSGGTLGVGAYVLASNSCSFFDCIASGNKSLNFLSTSTGVGFYIQGSTNIQFDACQAYSNGSGTSNGYGFKLADGFNNFINNSSSQGNFGANFGVGFNLTGTEQYSTIIGCQALTNTAGVAAYGILLNGATNCTVTNNSCNGNSGGSIGLGFNDTNSGANYFGENIFYYNSTQANIDQNASSFNGTFTSISALQNTVTACCAQTQTDFNQTWTILAAISNQINNITVASTFTVLNTINTNVLNTFTSIAALNNTVVNDFNGTFTSINSLQTTIVSGQPFISTFGDQIVSGRDDTISVQFQYGVAPYDVTTSILSTGTVIGSGSMAQISTGVGATGYANMSTNNRLRYRPGHEGYTFFTAMWPNGSAANSTQWAGLFDSQDGAAIGYSGTNFGILFRQGGVDTVTTQTNFNLDTINGSGPSGFNINPAFMNVFRIAYGWLGAAPIKYYVLNSNGQWINFHKIQWPNSASGPTFLNPVLPVAMETKKTSGASNLQINTSSINAGIVGEPSTAGSRYFSVSNSLGIAGTAGTEYHVITVQNKLTYQGKNNRVQVRIAGLGGGTTDTASEASVFRLRTNATVTGTAFQDVDSQNSVMQYSTTGTYSAGTGTQLFIIPNNTYGSGPQTYFIPKADLTILLNPGQSATITAQSFSGTITNFVGSVTWEEQF